MASDHNLANILIKETHICLRNWEKRIRRSHLKYFSCFHRPWIHSTYTPHAYIQSGIYQCEYLNYLPFFCLFSKITPSYQTRIWGIWIITATIHRGLLVNLLINYHKHAGIPIISIIKWLGIQIAIFFPSFKVERTETVSYTHLTLPTIYSV